VRQVGAAAAVPLEGPISTLWGLVVDIPVTVLALVSI